MPSRLIFVCSLLALFVITLHAQPKHELYVIQAKPSVVAIVDTERGVVTTKIPLEKNPTHAIADSQGRFLYVAHNGGVYPPNPGLLSIVDLAKGTVIRQIPLGFAMTRLQFSQSERELFCFAQGKMMISKRHKLKPGQEATVTIIDTTTQDIKAVRRLEGLADDFVMTQDGAKVFAFSPSLRPPSMGDAIAAGLSLGILMTKALPKNVNQEMTVFGGIAEQALTTTPLQNHLQSVAFSRNEKLLFLLGQNLTAPDKGGTLQIVDVESGKLLRTEAVGADPQRLIRLGAEPGLWLAGKEEMRFLTEDGVLAQERLLLNKTKNDEPAGKELDGYPGETILLADRKVAVLITKKNGAPTNRLAVVDLEKQLVERIVPVGRSSVRAGKMAARIGLAVGLSVASYGVFSAAGAPSFMMFYPTFGGGHNENLWKREDGKYFYVLNNASNDVTVVQSADGAVSSHIPVDAMHYRLWMPPGGKYLFCLGGDKLNIIDTETNQKHAEHKLSAGALVAHEAVDHNARLYLLTGKELEVWDGKTATRSQVIFGISRPLLLVRRNQITP